MTDQHSDDNPLSPSQGCLWLEAMGKLEPVTHNFQPRAALSVYPYVPYKFCHFLSEEAGVKFISPNPNLM